MKLSTAEQSVRALLVRVARGNSVGKRRGRISYKEVWQHVRKNDKWSMARTPTVVGWITRISSLELQANRPPLNELVTPTNKLVPTESWGNATTGIRAHLRKLSNISAPYRTHEEAQQACWSYWSNHVGHLQAETEAFNTDFEVEEGYREDRQASFIRRNKSIIDQAKKRDKSICQACKFFLRVDGRPVIDCHHTVPLSHSGGSRVTRLSDLVCLCPTCHRIAHTKPYPLSVERIRSIRGL